MKQLCMALLPPGCFVQVPYMTREFALVAVGYYFWLIDGKALNNNEAILILIR